MRLDSDSDRDDEVVEVKRAMREARARKKSLETKLKGQFTRDAQEKSELELIIRSLREELDVAKSQLNDTRYDLKEAKFELAQVQTKCDKLNEERKLMESVHRTQQLELQLKMESSLKRNEEKSHLFSVETEKLAKVAEKLVKDVSSDVGRHQALRTHLHLLEKLAVGLNKMKDINSGASSVSSIAELKASMSLREKEPASVDSAVDNSLLDMCRNLEEENIGLTETIADLKNQLTEAKREAAASKLIPHYQLAVMRAKTHADNLAEQIKRERETSEGLREQLSETYEDLKKVVEEKRKLYKRLGKVPLEDDEKLLKKGVHISIQPKSSRSSSPVAARGKAKDSRAKMPPGVDYKGVTMNEASIDKAVLESCLQGDLKDLDSQIDMIREQLERAAALQSQKILSQVVDHSAHSSSYFD